MKKTRLSCRLYVPHSVSFTRESPLLSMIAVLLLAVSSLQVQAKDSLDQEKISINKESAAVKLVLKEIERQTKLRFFYNTQQVDVKRKVTVSFKDTPVGDVIEEVFKGTSIHFKFAGRQILLFDSALQVNPDKVLTNPMTAETSTTVQTVSGKVMDEQGQPLPGVNVIEKGTTNGTSTDADGKYNLSVSGENAVLIFSFIGYVTEEIPVGTKTVIDIKMGPDITSLSEVVVTGYGSQEKKVVTGAVASISERDISSISVTGFDQAMQGRMAGVQVTQNSGEPGGSVSVRIRGVGSINNTTEPLYVVDGIPLAGNLNGINPNDIERIDVLKDAASAAIYGSRGTNGVVLVTTKRGKAGKLTLSLNSYVGVQNSANKVDLLNGPQFAKLANENLANAGLATNPAWDNPESQPSYDWQDAIFQSSSIQSHNVSVGSGSEKSQTFFSLGYFQQGGLIIGSDFERYTVRLNTDYNIGNRVKVGGTFNVSYYEKQTSPTDNNYNGILTNVAMLQPTMPIYSDVDGQNGVYYGWEGYNFISKNSSVDFYPTGLNNEVHTNLQYNRRYGSNLQLLAAAFAEVEIIKELKFRSTLNVSVGNSFGDQTQRAAPAEISDIGQYRNSTKYTESWDKTDQVNWINSLSYKRTIGKHNLSALVAMDALKNNYRYVNVDAANAPEEQFSIDASDSESRTVSGSKTGGPSTNYSLVSYIGRVTYDYNDKYLLTVNVRRDGSSKFAPGNRYGTFPSASVGWRLSEESFMQSVRVVNDLKMRISYGEVGNQNIQNFAYYNTYSDNRGTYVYVLGTNQDLVSGIYLNSVADPTIHWEKSTQVNFGVDAALMNGMFTLSADYYIKKLSDLLGNVNYSSVLGIPGNTILRNSFSMENKGLEIALGFNKKLGAVDFSANANFSTLSNKVTKLNGVATDYVSQSISVNANSDGNASTRTYVGDRIGNFYGYVTDGIIQNTDEVSNSGMTGLSPGDRRYKDIVVDGVVDDKDRTVLGNGLPKYIFGLNLEAKYKMFDLSVFMNGQAEVEIANMTKFYTGNMRFYNTTGIVNGSTDLLKSWNGEGTSNEVPRNSYNTPNSNRYFSSAYIENGAFLRFRNVQLGYTVPSAISGKLKMTNARIYVAAQNLFTFTNYTGYDPEIGSGNINGSTSQSQLTTGVDYGRYPTSRTFMLGVNLQF